MLPKLRRVLDRSREVGLKSDKKKVKLRVPEVSYVGHVFSASSRLKYFEFASSGRTSLIVLLCHWLCLMALFRPL